MKTIKLLSLLFIVTLTSCSSVRVNYDYDKNVNFDSYKSFAYLKSGIDKAEISDLDKKRILYAIDETMISKGFVKSENPDLLISFFTQERERVDIMNNWGFGWGWGWNPWWGVGFNNISTTTEGTLIVDIIDAKSKELLWQGNGTGYLTTNTNKKEERIKEFVTKILLQFPPQKK